MALESPEVPENSGRNIHYSDIGIFTRARSRLMGDWDRETRQGPGIALPKPWQRTYRRASGSKGIRRRPAYVPKLSGFGTRNGDDNVGRHVVGMRAMVGLSKHSTLLPSPDRGPRMDGVSSWSRHLLPMYEKTVFLPRSRRSTFGQRG